MSAEPLSFAALASVSAAWTYAPVALALLFGLLYGHRCRTVAREGQPVPGWQLACFGCGLLVFVLALVPPLGPLSQQLLMAHMAELLLLGDICSLLVVLGLTAPLIAPLLQLRAIGRLRVLTNPVVAIVCWAVNFYGWHWPAAYQFALRHQGIRAIEFATFFIFGSCIWMALLGPLPKPASFGNSARLVYIIAVRLIGSVLGNVLVFGGTVFYGYYRAGEAHWHLSPLGDQVYAGAIMMFEESILTICLFAWLFARVARETEERQDLLDMAGPHGAVLRELHAARAASAARAEELRERLQRSETGADATRTPVPGERS
jgi:putative membrane protein